MHAKLFQLQSLDSYTVKVKFGILVDVGIFQVLSGININRSSVIGNDCRGYSSTDSLVF